MKKHHDTLTVTDDSDVTTAIGPEESLADDDLDIEALPEVVDVNEASIVTVKDSQARTRSCRWALPLQVLLLAMLIVLPAMLAFKLMGNDLERGIMLSSYILICIVIAYFARRNGWCASFKFSVKDESVVPAARSRSVPISREESSNKNRSSVPLNVSIVNPRRCSTITESDEGTVTLISSDEIRFTVDANVAKMSKLVELALDDDILAEGTEADREVQVPKVTAAVMIKIIEFCEHYQTEEMPSITTPLKSSKLEDMVQPFYAEFVKLDQGMLLELVNAANFMDIKPLLDLSCLAVSIMIKGKSAEELRSMFNLSTGVNPEEEARIREENKSVDESIP